MKLSDYFEQAKGVGVLATTDAAGQVNQALYERPLFSTGTTRGPVPSSWPIASATTTSATTRVPPICSSRRAKSTRQTVVVNPDGGRDGQGKNPGAPPRAIPAVCEQESRYLVHFHIEGTRPLLGNE